MPLRDTILNIDPNTFGMRISYYLRFTLILALILFACEEDECKDGQAPDYDVGITSTIEVSLIYEDGTEVVDPAHRKGHLASVRVFKRYCEGDMKGPFVYSYSSSSEGFMSREGIGYYSFTMRNKYDRLLVYLRAGPDEKEITHKKLSYDEASRKSGGIYHIAFVLNFTLNKEGKVIHIFGN